MQGLFSSAPRSLAEAVAGLSVCAEYDWTLSFQIGPFHSTHFLDPDDPRNVLHLLHDFSDQDLWFKRGLLPAYAPDIYTDEQSYYLGFDARVIKSSELHHRLSGNISPRAQLFETIAELPCVYLIAVGDGWWEAYTSVRSLQQQLQTGWDGRTIDSNRWEQHRQDPWPFADTP